MAELNDKELQKYWLNVMSRKMPFEDELYRLKIVLHGHYQIREEFYQNYTLVEFHNSKRPYGNKDIEASIAFQLGWDYQRTLCENDMPLWVREFAKNLHIALGNYIKNLDKSL